MRARFTWRSIVLVTAWGVTAVAVLGLVPAGVAQPMTKEIEYLIHETPSDPTSLVAFRIKLLLESSYQDGDSIGWDIISIEIREVGNPNTVWVDSSPSAPTVDGLWWIEHADPDNPTNDEFTMPPHLQGTADNQDPNDGDLDYDFEGKTYTAPTSPEEPPYGITAALDYAFARVGESNPLGSGEDEPVDVPPDQYGGGGS